MKNVAVVCVLALAAVGWARLKEHQGLDLQVTPAQTLNLQLSSGDYRIEAGAEDRLVIISQDSEQQQSSPPRFGLDTSPGEASIKVEGPKNYAALIQVPRTSTLRVRLEGGRLRVNGINGDKDIESNAGTVMIDMGKPEDYAHVEASVDVGHIDAAPFQIAQDGFERSFKHRGPGHYRLHAHVGTGEIMLVASGS
jgi:hypothetical protein